MGLGPTERYLVEYGLVECKVIFSYCDKIKFVRNIIEIYELTVCYQTCVLPLLNICLQYKTLGPSGLSAEALGHFFWQMVISN